MSKWLCRESARRLVTHEPGNPFFIRKQLDRCAKAIHTCISGALIPPLPLHQDEAEQYAVVNAGCAHAGSLPATWSNLTTLKAADLSNNNFTGMLHQQACQETTPHCDWSSWSAYEKTSSFGIRYIAIKLGSLDETPVHHTISKQADR